MIQINSIYKLALSDDEADKQILEWLEKNRIEAVKTNNRSFKILNGCIDNIMFYPTHMKLMFFAKDRNYLLTKLKQDNVIDLIKGTSSYKKRIL